MKKIIIHIFCLFLVLTSCNLSNKENTTENEFTSEKEVINEELNSEEIDLSSIKPIIQGIWLPREYVTDIYKTQSAYSSHNVIPDIAEMQINPDDIKNDTLYVGSSLNNHEGYGFRIWFVKRNDQIIIESDVRNWDSDQSYSELKYKIAKDTILQLITKNKTGIITDSIDYLRIRDKEFITQFGGLGFEYLARKILLNGTYEVYDSNKTSLGDVSFNADEASIEGFKHKFYTFQTDFIAGPSYSGDYIILRPNENDYQNTEAYVVQNISDTLVFFDTEEKASDSDYEIVLKKEMYYLLKK